MQDPNQLLPQSYMSTIVLSLVSVGLICTVIVLGVMLSAQKEMVMQLQQSVIALQTPAVILELENPAPTPTINIPAKEELPMYAIGKTVIGNSYYPVVCSKNFNNACDGIRVQTEIDLTEPSDGRTYTGSFYIRAYQEDMVLIDEYAITPTFLRFGGDGESDTPTVDLERIMTVTVADMRVLSEYFRLSYGLDKTFGGHTYRLTVQPTDTTSSFDNVVVDFLYRDSGEFTISIPQ